MRQCRYINSGLCLPHLFVHFTTFHFQIFQCELATSNRRPDRNQLPFQIIINRHEAIARFGIMHCMSSSLCFWVWTIFRETVEAISNHSDGTDDDDDRSSRHRKVSEIAFYSQDQPIALPLTSYNKRGAKLLTAYLNSTVRKFTEVCNGDDSLKTIYKHYSPYLYPFSVEYSILVGNVNNKCDSLLLRGAIVNKFEELES